MRFKVFGFGLVDRNPDVYLHYVRPERQAQAHDPARPRAGRLRHDQATARKKLFPFNAERGHWKLQFDTHRQLPQGPGRGELPLLHRRRHHQARIRLIVVRPADTRSAATGLSA